MSVSKKFELFGEEWKILVKENVKLSSSYDDRTVTIFRPNSKHSRIPFHKNEKQETRYLLRENKELPPIGEHVGETINEAMKKYLKQQEEQITKEQEIENAIETSTKIWEEQLTDIKQNS